MKQSEAKKEMIYLRKKSKETVNNTDYVGVSKIERRNHGTGKKWGMGKIKMQTVRSSGCFYNPAHSIAKAISDALNPDKVKPIHKCRTLSDMDENEIEILEKQYNCKVSR